MRFSARYAAPVRGARSRDPKPQPPTCPRAPRPNRRKVLSGALRQAPPPAPPADADVRVLVPADSEARRQRESLAKEVYDSDEERESAGPGGAACAQQ